jgi:phosphinothricin acetyltransferase
MILMESDVHFKLEPIMFEDGHAAIDIFNHYIVNTFAAYPENAVPYEFFGLFMKMAEGYPFLAAKDKGGRLLGFGLLRPHNPISAFSNTAEITCFLSPECTGKGIGRAIVERLLSEARQKGLTNVLAGISSLNAGSISFHEKCGFVHCGRFLKVGRKRGQEFDVVWMQRTL